MTTNELKNRERRLRYSAGKKGLRIQKRTFAPITGYWISEEYSGLVIAGSHHYQYLMPIDEAEEFVAEY